MTHVFEVEVAERYGVNAAIVLNLLRVWIAHNAANKKNVRDGRTWTYNSTKAWAKLLPYLSEKQVRSAIDVLTAAGLVVKANFNENTYDRTLWYALTDETIRPLGQMDAPASSNRTAPPGESLIQLDKPIDQPSAPAEPSEVEKALKRDGENFVDWFLKLLSDTGAEALKTTATDRENWADVYEKLVRIDGRSKKEIAAVCRWARGDNFWCSNFLSPAKLRKKNRDGVLYFDVFNNRMKSDAHPTTQKPHSRGFSGSNVDAFAELDRQMAAKV